MFPNEPMPDTSVGEGENVWGVRLEPTGRVPHPQLALTPLILRRRTFKSPKRRMGRRHLQGSPKVHLPSPSPAAAAPEVRAQGAPGPAPPHTPPIPRRSWASGAGGPVLRPGALFTTRNKSSPSGSGQGVSAGSGPTPADPEEPRTPNSGPHSSSSRVPPLAPPSGLGLRVPAPLPSAPAPAHHWPAQARRAARVPPAPSPHQPSGKLSNSRRSPQLGSPGAPRARGVRAGPRRTPTGCLAGSGPEPPGWAAASQRSTGERQVELHDWGGAGGCPRGQTREPGGRRLRAQSGAGADCAATPRQVSPPEQQCLPRTDLRE